jgi:hypothetical protein
VSDSDGEDLGVLVEQPAQGSLQPQIGFEGGWRELPGTVATLREYRYQGKAVLHVDRAPIRWSARYKLA